jgi:hypothetical protein
MHKTFMNHKQFIQVDREAQLTRHHPCNHLHPPCPSETLVLLSADLKFKRFSENLQAQYIPLDEYQIRHLPFRVSQVQWRLYLPTQFDVPFKLEVHARFEDPSSRVRRDPRLSYSTANLSKKFKDLETSFLLNLSFIHTGLWRLSLKLASLAPIIPPPRHRWHTQIKPAPIVLWLKNKPSQTTIIPTFTTPGCLPQIVKPLLALVDSEMQITSCQVIRTSPEHHQNITPRESFLCYTNYPSEGRWIGQTPCL